MSQSIDEKVREVTAKYAREAKEAEERALQARKAQSTAADAYDRRLAERQEQEAKEAEHRARQELSRQTQQLRAMSASEEWTGHIDARIKLYLERWFGTMFTAQCKPVLDDIGEVLAKDRRIRCEEDEAVVAEIRNWTEGKIETKTLPRIEALEQQLSKFIGQSSGRADALGDAIQAERAARETEVRTAVQGVKDWSSERPETKLLERLETLEQRFAQYVGQAGGRTDALAETVATECADRRKEIADLAEQIRHWVRTEFEAGAEALAERLKAMPGRLPVALDWKPENVVYQGQFVSHNGALWQAKADTAQPPGSDAWLCVARAGRDAVMPTVCGTYDAREIYHQLDVVALDGGSFIATRDNPGMCPGEGWQLICKQGKRGQRGERGPVGPKGDKGEPVMPELVNSKIDENYNLVVLRSDKSLEIIPLREAFERYDEETRP